MIHNYIARKLFSDTIYSNLPILSYVYNGDNKQVLDGNPFFYSNVIKTYLEKRYITKEEIWPKIYIKDPIEGNNKLFENQKLFYLRELLTDSELNNNLKKNNINTQFIMSCHLEPYFKQMADEYLNKVYINGCTISMEKYNEYIELKNYCNKQYYRFFFGDEVSELETYVQNKYLEDKKDKYISYAKSEVIL